MNSLGILTIYLKLLTLGYGVYSIHTEKYIPSVHSSESIAAPYLKEVLPAAEDVLPNICRNLDMQDLLRSRSVCTLFKEVVDQLLRQRGPELKALQVKRIFRNQPQPEHLSRSLRAVPRIVLFFTGNKCPIEYYQSISDEIFARFTAELPSDVQIIHAAGLATLLDGQPIEIRHNQALGLFLPQPRPGLIEVQTFAISKYFVMDGDPQIDSSRFVQSVFDVPDDHFRNNHFGLIFLNSQLKSLEYGYQGTSVQRSSMVIERRIMKMHAQLQGSLALWGSNVEYLSVLGMGEYDKLPISSFVARISGPQVRSWSIAVDITDSPDHNSERIIRFRKSIHFNDKSIGLLLITTREVDGINQAIHSNKPFRAAFPSLRIMSFGIAEKMPKYCYDSLKPWKGDPDELNMEIYTENYVCFMVITYL